MATLKIVQQCQSLQTRSVVSISKVHYSRRVFEPCCNLGCDSANFAGMGNKSLVMLSSEQDTPFLKKEGEMSDRSPFDTNQPRDIF